MKIRLTLALIACLAAGPALAEAPSAPGEANLVLMPNDVLALSAALRSIGTKERICHDGQNEKPCLEPVPVPVPITAIVARDIVKLKSAIEELQAAQHQIIGEFSNNTGYIVPGSKEEAQANFKLAELARIPIKITLLTIPARDIDDKLPITPTARAALLPILEE